MACIQLAPNLSAVFTPVQETTGCGSRHRSLPTGGAAKGMPLKTRIEGSLPRAPEIWPPVTATGCLMAAKAGSISSDAMATRDNRMLRGILMAGYVIPAPKQSKFSNGGNSMRIRILALGVLLIVPVICLEQVTATDYERATKLRDRFQGLAINNAEPANVIENTNRFWYRKSVKGGNQFVVVDAQTLEKKPAFDHERLAAAISSAAGGQTYTALTLPFSTFRFAANESAITFNAAGAGW